MSKKSLTVAFILAVSAIFLGLLSTSCQGKEDNLTDTAKGVFFTDQRLFDHGLIDEDIKLLTEEISSNPGDAQPLVARGFIYAALNDFDKGIADLEKAAEIDPNIDTADPYGPSKNGVYYLLALAYWQIGDPGKSIPLFSRVIEANPEHHRSYYYRGMANLARNDRPTAIKDIEKAYDLSSGSLYSDTLQELQGIWSEESIFASYVVSFLPNKPPQNRPFGYIWEIRHEIK